MSKLKGVSPSQLDAMDCRLKWSLGYPKGFRPIKAAIPLELGIGIHEALEYYHKGDQVGAIEFFASWAENRIDQLGIDATDRFIEAMTLGKQMITGYVEEYADRDDFEVLVTEQTLRHRLPIPDGGTSRYTLTVRLDGLVREHETAKLYSLEHKTYARLDPKAMEMNQQFTAQIWLGRYMADKLGLEDHVHGVIYNGLRKQAPGPRVKAPLFHREKLYRTESEIHTMLYRAYWACREFAQKDLAIYPQPSPIRCSMCDFRGVCLEMQRGGDWESLLEMDFTRRSNR